MKELEKKIWQTSLIKLPYGKVLREVKYFFVPELLWSLMKRVHILKAQGEAVRSKKNNTR